MVAEENCYFALVLLLLLLLLSSTTRTTSLNFHGSKKSGGTGEALLGLSIAQQLNRSDGLQLGCRNSKMAVSFFPVV